MKRRLEKKAFVPLLLGLAAAFLAVLLLGSGLTLAPLGLERTDLPVDGPDYVEPIRAGENIIGYTSAYTFTGIDIPTRTVGITTLADGDPQAAVLVELQQVQRMPSGKELVTHLDEAYLVPAGRHNTAVFKMYYEQTPMEGFRLLFHSHTENVRLQAATLNASGFQFNVGQFALLACMVVVAWLVIQFGWYRVVYNSQRWAHRFVLLGVAVLCAGLAFALMNTVNGVGAHGAGELRLLKYPEQMTEILDTSVHPKFYYHLFDALKNGQTSLLWEANPELALLENPYLPAQREGIIFPQDFAYYKGSYYVYFGPAPMLLYYACYYLLGGRLPSVAVASGLPAIVTVFLCLGALLELLRYFEIKPNLLLLTLAYPAVLFGSLLFTLVSSADGYEEPYIWAMLGLAGFVFLFYRGMRTGRGVWRGALFALAGFFFVVIAAGRPAVVLLALAFAVPAALGYLRRKDLRPARRLVDLAAFALPVLAGAAVLMAYNYSRFESPFSFGNTHQLTAWDMREQRFRFSPVWLVQAVVLFVFTPVTVDPQFPFFSYRYYSQVDAEAAVQYGFPFVSHHAIGLINYPIFWALGALPKTLRGRPLVKKATYISVLCGGLVIIWLNFCIGNMIARYVADAALALMLLAALVLLEVASCSPGGARPSARLLSIGMCAATIFVGFMLCFSNERNFILRLNPDVYLSFAGLFRLG